MYEYSCSIIKVVDGDTVDAQVDLGFDISIKLRFRLAWINAPEMNTEEGKAAKLRLMELLPVATICNVRTLKDKREKYGRYLADIQSPQSSQWVCETLVKEGHACWKDYNAGIDGMTVI
jgi:micrococcal nuclease